MRRAAEAGQDEHALTLARLHHELESRKRWVRRCAARHDPLACRLASEVEDAERTIMTVQAVRAQHAAPARPCSPGNRRQAAPSG